MGFAKKGGQNAKLLRDLPTMFESSPLEPYPVLVGPSRKKFIATAAGKVGMGLRTFACRLCACRHPHVRAREMLAHAHAKMSHTQAYAYIHGGFKALQRPPHPRNSPTYTHTRTQADAPTKERDWGTAAAVSAWREGQTLCRCTTHHSHFRTIALPLICLEH